ncbi:MAG: tetratricopeptide repeat protein, partial [Planctomycetota bacterium]
MFKNRFCWLLLLLLPVVAVFGDTPTQLEQAVAQYEQIVADHPGTDEALEAQEKLVGLYVKEKMGAEAEAAYEKLITDYASHTGMAKAVDHVADAYREQKDYDKALEIYQYMVDTYPQAEHAIDSQMGVARIKILQKDYAGGQEAVDKLISDYGSSKEIAKAIDNVGDAYRDAGKYVKALELYNWVVTNGSDVERAIGSQASVVKIYIEMDEYDKAKAETDELISRFGSDSAMAKGIDNIADSYRKARKFGRARELYQWVVENQPEADHAMQSQVSAVKVCIAMGDDPNTET